MFLLGVSALGTRTGLQMTAKLDRLAAFTALLLALCGVAGCIDFDKFLNGPGSRSEQEPELKATIWTGPRVRPGVALAISVTAAGVSNRESKQYFVDAEGCISMELVGTLNCNGLTLVELQQKIAAAYKEYYVDPSVTATFVYQPGGNMVSPWGTVTVLGEVGRPGPVDMPSTEELPLTRALMLAGGANSIADKRRVLVTRCLKDGTQQKTRVNLNEIGEDGRADKDMALKAGDVVWVPIGWY